jgi:HlyD family type I secretion membrane fusion protein
MTDLNNKEKFNIQELQKLLMQFSAEEKGSPEEEPQPEQPKPFKERVVIFVQAAIAKIKFWMQESVHYIDRFINFVIKNDDPDRNEIVQYARPPILFGTAVMVIFIGFGGMWAGFAPLDSAAHAMGKVIANKNKQMLQYSGHSYGVVKNIFVKQGDHVKAGDPLVEFDDVSARSSYENYLNQYLTLLATQNRLVAERDNLNKIEFNPILFQYNSQEIEKIVQVQTNIFNSSKELLVKEEESYNTAIKQNTDRLYSAKKSLNIYRERLKSNKELLKEGHVSKMAVDEIAQKEASFFAEVTAAEQEITKYQIAILKHKEDHFNKVSERLSETQMRFIEASDRLLQSKENLDRVVLRSPVDGVVNSIFNHTIGAVLQPSSHVLEVTPDDRLIVEVYIPVSNIDSVMVGQKAKMKFLAFKSRTSPLFTGTVISVSPDSVQDPQAAQGFAQHNKMMARAGQDFYIAKVEIDQEEFEKIAKPRGLKLLPGMSCDIQIVTGTRTLIRYLLDPVLDQAFKAFKEK